MAEDIDIEEHNIFENPWIKNIFPNISELKQEIFDEDLQQETKNYRTLENKNDDNDLISGGLIVSPKDLDVLETSKVTNNVDSLRRKVSHESKRRELMKSRCKNVRVVLKDISSFLMKSRRFCKTCLVFFKTRVTFKNHKQVIHGGRVEHRCCLCMNKFSNSGNLNRHERLVHCIRSKKNMKIAAKYSTTKKIAQTSDIQLHNNNRSLKSCFHCNIMFPTEQDLIDHLYIILYSKKEQVATGSTKQKKEICSKEQTMSRSVDILQQKNVGTTNDITSILETKAQRTESKSIYSCPICSYYFNEEIFCKSHVVFKHNTIKAFQIGIFNPTCKFCHQQYFNVSSYNAHLRKNHKNEMIRPVNKVLQFCKNTHISKANTLEKHNKYQQSVTLVQNYKTSENAHYISNVYVMVSKVFIFECSECCINFLTYKAATKHSEHLQLEDNWECISCRRLFKYTDAHNHQKQHEYSNYFSVLKVNNQIPTLYKCIMCAVHFSKENFLNHSRICQTEQLSTRKSTYCRVCNIYLESSLQISHESDHNERNLIISDFNIIVSEKPALKNNDKINKKDCIDDDTELRKHSSQNASDVSKKSTTLNNTDDNPDNVTQIQKNKSCVSVIKNQLHLGYCNTCKCYLRKNFKRPLHLKSRCINIAKCMCKYCGLTLPNKTAIAHTNLHRKYRNLKLQDFTFYDVHSNKTMKPVIAKYPKCELCEKHFITKKEAETHMCVERNYVICHICKCKFSNAAYKLHMPFHNYNFNNVDEVPEKIVDKCALSCDMNDIVEVIEEQKSPINEAILPIYICKNCNLSVNTYDEVIEHCYLHTNLNKVEVNEIECTICCIKFETSSYKKHVEMHKNLENDKFIRLSFDVLYFGSDNDKWLKHVFKSLNKKLINTLIYDSIYKYENKIKMEVIQEGPSHLTIYKCERCHCVVDCNSIYIHIPNCCPDSEISDCSFCYLPFACTTTRNAHEKIHATAGITLKSYRIVAFNRDHDRNINKSISNLQKYHVVYECRYCHVLVEKYSYSYHICDLNKCKKCNVCGLIIYSTKLHDHVLKHKLVPSFNENKIKVILLGNRTQQNKIMLTNKNLVPSFNGIVCDYTFYKCVNCEVCIRDVRNSLQHSCVIDAAKSQCSKCDLIFEEGKIKGHLKLHDMDPDLTKQTILVNTFDNNKLNKEVDQPINILEAVTGNKVVDNMNHNTKTNDTVKNKTNTVEMIAKLYKCSCGLHYIQHSALLEHVKKCFGKKQSKQSIQDCSKCGLTFTSDVLFKHIIDHHGDKNVFFKYKIVENSTQL